MMVGAVRCWCGMTFQTNGDYAVPEHEHRKSDRQLLEEIHAMLSLRAPVEGAGG